MLLDMCKHPNKSASLHRARQARPNAVLCDCVRHLYIYRQPAPTENTLKNRKSGQIVGAIAKQQLISLDTD